MKKALLIASAVVLLAGSISASGYHRAYIGVYASAIPYEEDTNYVDNHSVCTWTGPVFSPFELWIWILPSTHGVRAVEYRVKYPTMVIFGSFIQNPAIIISLGSLNRGIIATYGECQTDWTWCHHQEIFSMTTTPRYFSIGPHPLTGLIQVAGCDEDFTLEPCWPLDILYIYAPCIIGTKEASWGAIKSLF